MVSGDVHLRYRLHRLSALEELSYDPDRSVTSGRVRIPTDESRDKDTPAEILHDLLDRTLPGRDNQVGWSPRGRFPAQLPAVVPIHVEVLEHAGIDHGSLLGGKPVAVEQSTS